MGTPNLLLPDPSRRVTGPSPRRPRSRNLRWCVAVGLAAWATALPAFADGPATPHRMRSLDAGGRVVLDETAGRRSYADEPAAAAARPRDRGFVPPSWTESWLLPPAFRVVPEWHRVAFGSGIGAAGLAVADVDADGVLEIVAAASPGGFEPSSYWYVLEWDGTGYTHRWSSLPFEEAIDRLEVAQLDGDEALEVAVFVSGRLLVLDGSTFELELDLEASPVEVRDIAFADVDGDPSVEAVLCGGEGTWVYDLATGAAQLADPQRACVSVAVGETDGTAGAELLIAAGDSSGFVLDAATGALEWTHALGFGDLVAVGDVDGDAVDEILVGHRWSGVEMWHGDTHSFGWTVPVVNLAEMTVADVEGDGPLEVVYGDAQWGGIHVLDGLDGTERWSVENPDHGVTGVAVGDADSDGDREIYFGAGFTSTGPDHLFVVDTVSRLLEWRSTDISGPFLGLAHGDVDADGEPEVVYTTFASDGGYGDGLYFVHDAATKGLEYQSPGPTSGNRTGLWKVQVADVVGDAALEIFLPSSSGYTGVLQCRDGATHAPLWEAQLTDGTTFAALRIADPDGDGSLETVTGVAVQHGGAEAVNVFLHDAASGVEEWRSPNLESFFGYWATLDLLRVADIDGDGAGEILVTQSGSDLLALDPVAGTVDLATVGLAITALDVAGLDGDGRPGIVVGTADGFLLRIDAANGEPTTLAGPFAGGIDGLAVADVIPGDGPDFVLCADDRVHVVDGATMATVWQSPDLGTDVGASDSLVAEDVDRDGRIEIWVSTGVIGHLMLEVRSPAVALDPSEL